MYNEIIEIPFLGFNENTRTAIAKREHKDGDAATDAAYLSLSPGAAYDATRNKRSLAKNDGRTEPEWSEIEQEFKMTTRNLNSTTLSS